MITPAIIARLSATGFKGVEHRFDGGPEHLGQALWDLYHERFPGQLETLLAALLDQHPAG